MTATAAELADMIQRLEALRAKETEPAIAAKLDRALDILRDDAETRTT